MTPFPSRSLFLSLWFFASNNHIFATLWLPVLMGAGGCGSLPSSWGQLRPPQPGSRRDDLFDTKLGQPPASLGPVTDLVQRRFGRGRLDASDREAPKRRLHYLCWARCLCCSAAALHLHCASVSPAVIPLLVGGRQPPVILDASCKEQNGARHPPHQLRFELHSDPTGSRFPSIFQRLQDPPPKKSCCMIMKISWSIKKGRGGIPCYPCKATSEIFEFIGGGHYHSPFLPTT